MCLCVYVCLTCLVAWTLCFSLSYLPLFFSVFYIAYELLVQLKYNFSFDMLCKGAKVRFVSFRKLESAACNVSHQSAK